MAFSFNKLFPRIPQLPPKAQFINIKFINQGLDLLNISNIFRDHRVGSKSDSISRILTLLLFVISTKYLLEIFSTSTKSHLILRFGVIFNLLALVRTRHFCIHLQAMLSWATLPISLTKDSGYFLRKGLNTDFHPGLILLSAGVLSRKHFRHTVIDGIRRKASECMPLTTGKNEFWRIVDIRIYNFTKHPHLYKQPPSHSAKVLERKIEKLHSKYVFAPADKATNNVIIIWKRY